MPFFWERSISCTHKDQMNGKNQTRWKKKKTSKITHKNLPNYRFALAHIWWRDLAAAYQHMYKRACINCSTVYIISYHPKIYSQNKIDDKKIAFFHFWFRQLFSIFLNGTLNRLTDSAKASLKRPNVPRIHFNPEISLLC